MKNPEQISDDNTNIFEENSGLALEKIFLPKVRLQKLIENGNLLKLSGIDQIKTTSKDCSKNNYMLVVFYSISNDLKYHNDKDDMKYAVWNITDLRGNKSRLYFFGEVIECLLSEVVGHLYLLTNPSIITSDGKNSKSYLSISKINQIAKVGKVRGFSICKGMNKNGTICSNPIDLDCQGPLCKYHLSSRSTENLKRYSTNDKLVSSTMPRDGKSKLAITRNTENLKTNSLQLSSNENNIHYRRLLKTNMSGIELSKRNEDLKRSRADVYDQNIHQKNDIFYLKNQLNRAIKENNTAEILSVLRYLSNIDISNITVDKIINSGIIYSISNIELNTVEIETAIFALKIRHKFCNSKGYWPKIKTENPGEYEKFTKFNLYSDKSYKVHKKISSLEEEISKKESKYSDLLIESVVGGKQVQVKQKSPLNNILSKIEEVVSLNTSCDDAIRKLESVKLKKKLIDLEEADKTIELKRNINSVKICNAVNCTKCGIWTEGNANPICKKEHPESIIYNQNAKKESWLCKSCNGQIYSINGNLNTYCPKCKADTVCNLKKNSIYKLREEYPNLNDVLIIRNGERRNDIESVDII